MERVALGGSGYLEFVTRLLQRCRLADPTAGLWEAADFQWWWRRVRSSDERGQLFWLDSAGEPLAAFVLTDWGDAWEGEVVRVPGEADELFDEVFRAGLEQMDALTAVEVRVRDDDEPLRAALAGAGFRETGGADTTTWMDAGARPAVSQLSDGFRLRSRVETAERQHHMIGRNGERVAERLAGCSLYDPELDLLIEAPDGNVAGYALFWADPVTRVGLVEPMRVEDAYQRRGLARHLLTAGLDGLAASGCTRLKISFMNENPAARHLYLSAGFVPESTSRVYRRSR